MFPLRYEEARPYIEDGDIVFIHGSWKHPISALIMWFTKSHFSHVCIAFKMTTGGTDRLMCVEAQGSTRRRILNLSFYDDRLVTVIKAPKLWNDIQDKALNRVGIAKYNFIAAAYVGVREYMLKTVNVHLPSLNMRYEICSEFVADVLGLPETEISPQVLYEELLKISEEK